MKNVPTDEELEKEYLAVLNEGYDDLCRVMDSEDKIESIEAISLQQAKNAILWIEDLFISEFSRREEYEKCSKLKTLVTEIKQIKKL